MDLGFTQSKYDYSLFLKNGIYLTCILVYVYDFILSENSIDEINTIKIVLDEKSSIKDLGNLKYFLGFEIARSSKGISLCQHKFSLDMLRTVGLLAAKRASTPMDIEIKLDNKIDPIMHDITEYIRLIGKLLYLTHSRPNIIFVVNKLSQYISKPTNTHLHIEQFYSSTHGFHLFRLGRMFLYKKINY